MGETIEIDLREICKAIMKRIWVIVLCTILVAATALIYTVNFVAPQYTASVSMYVNNNSSKDNSYISSADLAVALRLVETYVNIIQSDTVLEKVANDTGLMLTTGQLRGMLDAEVVGETEMFRVTVTSSNPQMSADIANTIAKIAPDEISQIIEGSSAKIIDYAKVPSAKSGPNYIFNTIIGALCGVLVSTLAVVLCYMLDVRVKSEEDLTRIHTMPVLGMIPDMNGESKNAGKRVRR